MKTIYRYLISILILSVLWSCNSEGNGDSGEDNGGDNNNKGLPVEPVLVSDIFNWTETEHSGKIWQVNDEIGLFMFKHNTTDLVGEADNVKYHVEDVEKGTLVLEGDTIFFPEKEDEQVDFRAYSPYRKLYSDLKYRIRTDDQENVIDLLYSKNSTGRSSGNPNTFLRFEHVLSKIYFAVTVHSSMEDEDLSNMTISLVGMKSEGDFNLLNGTWEGVSVKNDVFAKIIEERKHYEALIIPHVVDNEVNVVLEYGPESDRTRVEAQIPVGSRFIMGEERKFSLLVVLDELIISETTIEDWEE